MEKKVILTIRAEQTYEGQEPNAVELVSEGVLAQVDDGWQICYEESDLTGLQGATTVFEVTPGRIVLSRSGALESRMVFEEGVRHDSLYQLDVGALMVCVCAKRIDANLSEDGGYMDVTYAILVEQSAAGTVRYHIDVKPAECR